MKKENKTERVVTEDNYREKVLKTMIILCWVILGVCFAVKLFGGNFFEIVCNNRRFIKVCKWIDSKIFVFYLLQAIVYTIGTSIYLFGASKNVLSKKHKLIVIIISLLVYIIKRILLFYNQYVSMIIESLFLMTLPILFGTKWWKSILLSFITYGFTLISVFVRNMGHIVAPDYSLIGLILLIDYYIMIILFWLYSEQLKRRK